MTRVIRSELLKLRTTRTPFSVAGGTLALIALIASIQVATFRSPAPATALHDALLNAGIALFFILVLGILSAAGEYYHGTITTSFLATPRRRRLLTAKTLVSSALGLLLAAAALGVVLAAVAVGSLFEDVSLSFAGHGTGLVIAGTLVAGTLFGALGVAIGAAVKSQTAAIVGSLIWFLLVESLLSGLVPSVGRLTPAGAVNGLLGQGSHRLPAWAAGILLVAYVAAAAAGAVVVSERRDVT